MALCLSAMMPSSIRVLVYFEQSKVRPLLFVMWFALPNNINVDGTICLYWRIYREPWGYHIPFYLLVEIESSVLTTSFIFIDNLRSVVVSTYLRRLLRRSTQIKQN